ncbi:TonB-dependent hemoglobin/transferrin/lactoferrin family receptor [Pseudomonas seleniipraecipitans]|uniref:TonB-dependent hemoglobin/transferrin/lactoferrin family receptor n=1 Tax=Phytopseudomonas seleniipraecipitans TaxID=640205 RepID=A0ABY5JBT3_9GAMM|nr:TonB-dependent hemoglobin/transferrin/lactoferrin family receptor [Pseudomonas seleniipraecipitans]UUD65512.1 TonB-dependent hemoglobin/transferrin/lactoferrin family receptor [Pseudomonas seleniipraecipitans]
MSSFPPFPLRSCLAMLLLTPTFTYAVQTLQLEKTTISATRTEQSTDSVPNTVSVLDQQDIDRKTVKNIRDLVRYEPGVSVSGTGSRFGLAGFTIRGIGGNRILTQVDGVPMPDAFAFGPFLDARRNYVDPDTLKRVEIIRGPASSLYGSDAIGGAVSFLTKDAADYLQPGDDAYARFKTGYDGADDSWSRSATFAGRQGSVDGLLHLGRRDGQALDTHGGQGGIGASREEANHQDYTANNLLAKLGWNYLDDDRLQLTYERYEDDADTRVLSEYSPTATVRTSDATDNTDRQRVSLQHTFALATPISDHAEWQLSYQESQIRQRTHQQRFSGGSLRERSRDSTYQEDLWAFNAKLDKTFETGPASHLLIYGLDLKRQESSDLRRGREVFASSGLPVPAIPGDETFPLSDFPDPTSTEYAFFVQDNIEIGRWTLLPGLRYDHYEMKPQVTQHYLNSQPINRNPADYRDEAISPKLGVSYQIDEAHSVYGQYAAGFRAPNAVDIFGEFINFARNYQTIANPSLKPETSDSYEIGVRGQYQAGAFGVALFYNRYDDFIEQVTLVSDPTGAGRMTFQYQNLDRVTIRGAEARGELFLGSFGMPAGSRLRSAIAYARGKDEASGQPINSVDPLKAVLGLGYDAPSGQFGGELTWTVAAAKERVDHTQIANQFEPSGYGTLDLSAYWNVGSGVSVNAGLFNLTDKQYWQWGDVRSLTENSPSLGRYSQPGRHAAVNLIWEI